MTDVGDNEWTVVDKVRHRQTTKCFVDQHRQLEIDTLTHGKPVELSEYWPHWRNVVASLGAGYKSGCRILH